MDNKNSKYYKNGINKNTYDMLFSDHENIPEKELDEIRKFKLELSKKIQNQKN